MPQEVKTAIISFLTVTLAFALNALYQQFSGRRKEFRDLEIKVSSISEDVVRLKTQTEFWWKAMEQYAVQVLHRPHDEHAHRDKLLDKYEANTLTADEARELHAMLVNVLRTHERHPQPGEVSAAMVLCASLQHRFPELVKLEKEP